MYFQKSNSISNLEDGCSLGIIRSNIVAYADDIVLIAPSAVSLQFLINVANDEISKLLLNFNPDKSKTIVFNSNGNKSDKSSISWFHNIRKQKIDRVVSFKYLGYVLDCNLCNANDIDRVKSKFFIEFNSILRKFSFAEIKVKVFLFKQYCLQLYGAELWFGCTKSLQPLRQFAVAYHKAVKKLLGLSSHESNHYACQEANLFIFDHLINKLKISCVHRIITKPCPFIDKNIDFFKISSRMIESVNSILKKQLSSRIFKRQ